MMPKINFYSVLAAFVLFFLPWIDIQCTGQSLATQTGIQTVYGGGSVPEGMDDGGSDERSRKGFDWRGVSFLVGVALLLIVVAGIAAFFALTGDDWLPGVLVVGFCGAAFGLIALQMAIGFPAGRELARMFLEEGQRQSAANSLGLGGVSASEVEVVEGMAAGVRVEYLPWLYLELLALSIPALRAGNGLLDRIRHRGTG